jgi:RecA/RadA recombinase
MAKKTVENEKSNKGSFLAAFRKDSAKMAGISLSAPPPKYWLDSGNYVLNKILSGSYSRGFASGRCTALAGPSGAGKSFLAGNAVKAALNAKDVDWGVLVIDSENAIDEDYLTRIGANVNSPYYEYRGVSTIPQTIELISSFTSHYRATNEDMPFLVVIDSLDMLMTNSEHDQYAKGEISGDQGQHAKQTKAMLKRFVQDIKSLNIVMLHTKQVYQEQEKILAYNDPWKMTESFKFAYSQIGLVTRTRIKNKETKTFEGITMTVRGEKTRFCKPFQTCKIEVPYDSGIDPYSGVLDAAVALGIVTRPTEQKYDFEGQTFKTSTWDGFKEVVLKRLIERETESLNVQLEEGEEIDTVGTLSAKEAELLRKTRQWDDAQSEADIDE